jgi:glycosyltransferase involved in cell wall biosynthesis
VSCSAELPFMSIVLCAYNSEDVIARALESLLAQDYPRELFEIVVVDDGSSDRTAQIVARYPVLLVHHKVNLGRGAARNSGLPHIKGSVYVCFDDDCEVGTDWLRQLAKGYKRQDAAGVGSSIEEKAELWGVVNRFMAAAGKSSAPSLRLGASSRPWKRFKSYFAEQLSPQRQDSDIYPVRQLNSATASFPADVVRSVGGWDTSLRAIEDLDLCSRIAKKYPGLHFYTVSTARIMHDPSMTLWQFVHRPYIRGLDTLRYYRSNNLTPPVFPFPIIWAAGTVLTAAANPPLGAVALLLLPQALYPWWPLRAVREATPWHLLFAYLQLAEESATIAGLARGRLLIQLGTGDVRS